MRLKIFCTCFLFLLSALSIPGCGNEYEALNSKVVRERDQPMTPEEARERLKEMRIEYSEIAFLRKIQRRDLKAVKLFLKAGMSPDTTDSYRILGSFRGIPVFLYVVKYGDTEMAKVFLCAGANPNTRDGDVGFTVLMTAASQANVELVEALIDAGADVNAEAGAGWTPLMTAAIGGKIDGADALTGMMLDAVIGLKAEIEGGSSRQSTSSPVKMDSQDCPKIVMTLIQHGADVNAQMRHGETALMLAARKGRTDVVRMLLDHGADPGIKNMVGETAMILASRYGHSETAQLLNREAKSND